MARNWVSHFQMSQVLVGYFAIVHDQVQDPVTEQLNQRHQAHEDPHVRGPHVHQRADELLGIEEEIDRVNAEKTADVQAHRRQEGEHQHDEQVGNAIILRQAVSDSLADVIEAPEAQKRAADGADDHVGEVDPQVRRDPQQATHGVWLQERQVEQVR